MICAHHLMYTVHTHHLKCGYIFISYGHLWTLISTICGLCGCMWVWSHYVVCVYLSVQQFTYKRMCWYVLLSILLCLPLSTQPNLICIKLSLSKLEIIFQHQLACVIWHADAILKKRELLRFQLAWPKNERRLKKLSRLLRPLLIWSNLVQGTKGIPLAEELI